MSDATNRKLCPIFSDADILYVDSSSSDDDMEVEDVSPSPSSSSSKSMDAADSQQANTLKKEASLNRHFMWPMRAAAHSFGNAAGSSSSSSSSGASLLPDHSYGARRSSAGAAGSSSSSSGAAAGSSSSSAAADLFPADMEKAKPARGVKRKPTEDIGHVLEVVNQARGNLSQSRRHQAAVWPRASLSPSSSAGGSPQLVYTLEDVEPNPARKGPPKKVTWSDE